MLSFNALIWYGAPNSNCLIFRSGHKNILEPETSRMCVCLARYGAVTLIHLLLKEPQWSH